MPKVTILNSQDGYNLVADYYTKKEKYWDSFEKGRVLPLLGDAKGKKILDVGAGNGRLTLRLAKAGALVTALDLSEEMLKKLQVYPRPGSTEVTTRSELGSKASYKLQVIDHVQAFGPYVNFFLNSKYLAETVLKSNNLKPKTSKTKIMVEFAHPNTHKPVHIGHLRTMMTGESMARIFANAGHKVVRANYQGDVGLHIAKCLWALASQKSKVKSQKTIGERAKFLGEVYAIGGQAYEKDEQAKKEIAEINRKIYSGEDKEINKIYKITRKWSLEYFDYIYKRVGTHFDRFYFESECFVLGKKIVLDGIKTGIFKESQGAVIFEGSKYGLHDRVFLNSQGLPTLKPKIWPWRGCNLKNIIQSKFYMWWPKNRLIILK